MTQRNVEVYENLINKNMSFYMFYLYHLQKFSFLGFTQFFIGLERLCYPGEEKYVRKKCTESIQLSLNSNPNSKDDVTET